MKTGRRRMRGDNWFSASAARFVDGRLCRKRREASYFCPRRELSSPAISLATSGCAS